MASSSILINIGILIIFTAIGFIEARRLRAAHPGLSIENVHQAAPYLYIVLVFCVLVFASVWIVDDVLLWNLPIVLQFFFMNIVWGSIIAILSFLFSLAFTLSHASLHKERWKLFFSGLMVISAIHIAQRNYTIPIHSSLSELSDPEGVILQTSGTSCAAASAANILEVFGIETTEREMAERFRTTKGGTTVAHIIYGMKELGFTCERVSISVDEIFKLNPPAMLFIDHPQAGEEAHAVAYMGQSGNNFEIWDPLEGKRVVDEDGLSKFWHGRALAIYRKERLDRH